MLTPIEQARVTQLLRRFQRRGGLDYPDAVELRSLIGIGPYNALFDTPLPTVPRGTPYRERVQIRERSTNQIIKQSMDRERRRLPSTGIEVTYRRLLQLGWTEPYRYRSLRIDSDHGPPTQLEWEEAAMAFRRYTGYGGPMRFVNPSEVRTNPLAGYAEELYEGEYDNDLEPEDYDYGQDWTPMA